jgi:hypothetical protein
VLHAVMLSVRLHRIASRQAQLFVFPNKTNSFLHIFTIASYVRNRKSKHVASVYNNDTFSSNVSVLSVLCRPIIVLAT